VLIGKCLKNCFFFSLFGQTQGLLGFLRQVYMDKIGSGVEIIFAGFVNDPDIPLGFRLFIEKFLIYLTYLQIIAILVLNTQNKLLLFMCSSHRLL